MMNVSELPDLVLENICHFLKDANLLSLQKVNRALYSFLIPYCEKIPTIFNIWKTNERVITNVHKKQHFFENFEHFESNLATCTFRIDQFGWNCNYRQFGFLFKLHHHSDINLNVCILIKFIKSQKIIKLGWSIPDFFKTETQSNMRTLFQPEQICLVLDQKGLIIKIPTFDIEVHSINFNTFQNHKFHLGTSLDGCTIHKNSLIVFKNGEQINKIEPLTFDNLHFFRRVLCNNDQKSFLLVSSKPRYFIDYEKSVIIEQTAPLVDRINFIKSTLDCCDNYFAFENCGPFSVKVYHMNNITKNNVWIWKLLKTYRLKNRDAEFVYCPILNKVLEILSN